MQEKEKKDVDVEMTDATTKPTVAKVKTTEQGVQPASIEPVPSSKLENRRGKKTEPVIQPSLSALGNCVQNATGPPTAVVTAVAAGKLAVAALTEAKETIVKENTKTPPPPKSQQIQHTQRPQQSKQSLSTQPIPTGAPKPLKLGNQTAKASQPTQSQQGRVQAPQAAQATAAAEETRKAQAPLAAPQAPQASLVPKPSSAPKPLPVPPPSQAPKSSQLSQPPQPRQTEKASQASQPSQAPQASQAPQTPRPERQPAVAPVMENKVSREVFLLTGGMTPAPLAPFVPLRRNSKPRRRHAWEVAPFESTARTDGLKLSHWRRVGASKEYAFERFAKKVQLVTYSDEEYTRVVATAVGSTGARVKRCGALRSSQLGAQKSVDGVTMDEDGTAAAGAQKGKVAATSAEDGEATEWRPDKRLAAARADGGGGSDEPVPVNVPTTRRGAVEKDATVASHPPKRTTSKAPAAPHVSGGSLRQGINYVPLQNDWTKDETDTLFSLCQQFDLRFAVIHDRWPGNLPHRSIDELKDRYYSVAKQLIEWRIKLDENHLESLPVVMHKHCQAITMNPFDYEYECIRKNQLQWQYSRSKAELREEEETVREARRIEANRKRLAKERQRLAKLLTPAGDVGTAEGRKGEQALAAAVAPQKTFPHRKTSSGAFARSSMLYTSLSQSIKVTKRIDAALNELGVGIRPTPTSIVVDNFDLLRMEIVAFLELHRTVLRKEEDLHAMRVKAAKLKGEPVPSLPIGVQMMHKKRKTDDGEGTSLFRPTGQQKD